MLYRERAVKNKILRFDIIDHRETIKWISEQSWLKGTVHEDFEQWVEDHRIYHDLNPDGDPIWSAVWCDGKLRAVYFSVLYDNPDIGGKGETGLYDGYLVVDPAMRGMGLGRSLDEYRLFRTHHDLKWHYNWTLAESGDLVEFNHKLGYIHRKPTEVPGDDYEMLWRFADPNGYSFD